MARKPRDKSAPAYQQAYDKLYLAHQRLLERRAKASRECTHNHIQLVPTPEKIPALKARNAFLEQEIGKQKAFYEARVEAALVGNAFLREVSRKRREHIVRQHRGIRSLQEALSSAEETIAILRFNLLVAANDPRGV